MPSGGVLSKRSNHPGESTDPKGCHPEPGPLSDGRFYPNPVQPGSSPVLYHPRIRRQHEGNPWDWQPCRSDHPDPCGLHPVCTSVIWQRVTMILINFFSFMSRLLRKRRWICQSIPLCQLNHKKPPKIKTFFLPSHQVYSNTPTPISIRIHATSYILFQTRYQNKKRGFPKGASR